MGACLRQQVSWRFINDNHQAEKERLRGNRKNSKNSFIRMIKLCTTLYACVCVCMCVCLCKLFLRIIVCELINDIKYVCVCI